mmetsp:Transcript_33763/g.61826  ORF Transcript_33763/g.61826 Transcript_33763/m.61826 type:complete len:694 (+) Transcript_33763:80-2161(+)
MEGCNQDIQRFMADIKDFLDGSESSGFPASQCMPSQRSESPLRALKLKRALFKELDILKTGRLRSAELHAFAVDAFKYSDTHQTWLKEVYFYLCVDVLKVDPSVGVHEAAFSHLLDALLDRFGQEPALITCWRKLQNADSRQKRADEAKTHGSTFRSINWKESLRREPTAASQDVELAASAMDTPSPGIVATDVYADAKVDMGSVEDEPSCGSSLAGDDVSTAADNQSQPDSVASTLADQPVTATTVALPSRASVPRTEHGITAIPLPVLLTTTQWNSKSWQEVVPSEADAARWKACKADLQNLVNACFTDAAAVDVAVFGSMASGFGTKLSDLDVVLLERKEDQHIDKRLAQVKILETVARAMASQEQKWTVRASVPHARIPILTVTWATSQADGSMLVQEVDISVNNRAPVQNTKLLRAYADCSPCVARLVVLVKYWANQCGISGASSGNLSPYAVTLMVIYFLQVYSFEHNGTGTLPVLTADMGKSPKWTPPQSLTTVLAAFFMFYGGLLHDSFEWNNEVVSVRLGQRKNKTDEAFAKLHKRMDDRINIEDPIELHRNLHDVLKQDREQALFEAFHSYGNWLVWYLPHQVPEPMPPFAQGPWPTLQSFSTTITPSYAQMVDAQVAAQKQMRQQNRRQPPSASGRAHVGGHPAAYWARAQEHRGTMSRPYLGASGGRFSSTYNTGDRMICL